jgi:hypothetical protein
MVKKLVLLFVCGVLAAGLISCDKSKKPPTQSPPAKTSADKSAPAAAPAAAANEGRDLAEKILATYDEAVAEAAQLAKDKPESAVLKPKLEQLIASYSPKMAELNTQYLALHTKDIKGFGQANIHLGEFRGKHIANAYNTLTPVLKYYNFEKGDKEIVQLLSSKLVALIDIAVKR